ncbi:MAG: universal stress protein [Halanaeroarchaeum sp.]
MPTHGREGLERVFLGSVTERVVDASAVPVLTVTPDADRTFDYPAADVLVPTDDSPGAGPEVLQSSDAVSAED